MTGFPVLPKSRAFRPIFSIMRAKPAKNGIIPPSAAPKAGHLERHPFSFNETKPYTPHPAVGRPAIRRPPGVRPEFHRLDQAPRCHAESQDPGFHHQIRAGYPQSRWQGRHPARRFSICSFTVEDGAAATDLRLAGGMAESGGECGFVKDGPGTMEVRWRAETRRLHHRL